MKGKDVAHSKLNRFVPHHPAMKFISKPVLALASLLVGSALTVGAIRLLQGIEIKPDWFAAISTAVQAFVAFVAIWIAVSSSTRSERSSEVDRVRRAKATAIGIYPDIMVLLEELPRAQHALNDFLDVVKRGESGTNLAKVEVFRQAIVRTPPMLDRAALDLWRLGDAAALDTSQMLSLIHQWNSLVEGAIAKFIRTGDGHFVASLQGNLAALGIVTHDADKSVSEILKDVVRSP